MMSIILITDGEVDENGNLHVELPSDAPRGRVRVTIEKVILPEGEEADELAELLSDESLNGLGQTMDEIMRSPEAGGWAHRTDIISGEDYVEKIRRGYRRK